jgi:phosphopantothenoylcysteine decarboxylase/phosphopantothenate--cysteine ligase
LIETPDIVATLGANKGTRWVVGFALETEDHRFRALAKLEKKRCDLIVLNGPEAMNSPQNHVEILGPDGLVLETLIGKKEDVANGILRVIQKELIAPSE